MAVHWHISRCLCLTRSAAIAIVIVNVIAVAPARAQVTDQAEVEALRLNDRSRKLYDQGRYAEAAELLRKAYRLKAVPILQYNLARACEGLRDDDCALAAYESYLPHAPYNERPKIEARLMHYRKRIANQRAPVTPVLEAAPAPEAAPPVPQPPPPASDAREPSHSVLPPIATATGVVGFGVGLYLAAKALEQNDDSRRAMTLIDARSKRDRAESLVVAGNAAMIGGGVVAVAGAVWWILDRRASHRPPLAAQLHIGPGTVAIRAAF
jgi:tetratricopeptide (TPR) repeat protein